MKDKNIVVVITVMICISVLCGLYLFSGSKMDSNVMYTTWYNYNIKNGNYDILQIKDDVVSYYHEQNDENEYDNCSSYKYNTKRQVISMDCGLDIHIKEVKKDSLIVSINKENIVFFNDIEESLEYEFKNFYNLSMAEYSIEKKTARDIIKVNPEQIEKIYNSGESSIISFVGNNCNNVDCVLLLNILEKWYVDSKNVFFVDSNSINEELLKELSVSDILFGSDMSFYNNNYPTIVLIKNNRISEVREFRCNGFDCTMWKNYAKLD